MDVFATLSLKENKCKKIQVDHESVLEGRDISQRSHGNRRNTCTDWVLVSPAKSLCSADLREGEAAPFRSCAYMWSRVTSSTTSNFIESGG